MATGLLLRRFDYLLTRVVTFVARQKHFSAGPVQSRCLQLVKVPMRHEIFSN